MTTLKPHKSGLVATHEVVRFNKPNETKYLVGFYGYFCKNSVGNRAFDMIDSEVAGFACIDSAENYAKALAEENPGEEVFIFSRSRSFTKEPMFKVKTY